MFNFPLLPKALLSLCVVLDVDTLFSQPLQYYILHAFFLLFYSFFTAAQFGFTGTSGLVQHTIQLFTSSCTQRPIVQSFDSVS